MKSRNGFPPVDSHVVPISLLPIHPYFIFLANLDNASPAVVFLTVLCSLALQSYHPLSCGYF